MNSSKLNGPYIQAEYMATKEVGRIKVGFQPAVFDGYLWYMYDGDGTTFLPIVQWTKLTEEEGDACQPVYNASFPLNIKIDRLETKLDRALELLMRSVETEK